MLNGIAYGLFDLFVLFFIYCIFYAVHDTARWSLIKEKMNNTTGRIFLATFSLPFVIGAGWIAAELMSKDNKSIQAWWEHFTVVFIFLEIAIIRGFYSKNFRIQGFEN